MRFLKLNESFFITQFQTDIISIHYKVFFERILPVKCLFHFVLLKTQNQRVLSSRREACDESTEGITLSGMRICLAPIF